MLLYNADWHCVFKQIMNSHVIIFKGNKQHTIGNLVQTVFKDRVGWSRKDSPWAHLNANSSLNI